jgi:Fe-S cluster biogenesis protein NfuA
MLILYKAEQYSTIMEEKIKEVLQEVRPSLQRDGGDVEFVRYNDGIVELKLTGACAGCPFSQLTIKNYIEKLLQERIPEIKEVKAV